MRPGFRAGLAAAVGIWLGVGACAGSPPIGSPPPRTPLPGTAPGDAGSVPRFRPIASRGAEIYEPYCAECHGLSGGGDGPGGRVLRPAPTDFTDVDYMWRQRPQWYYRAVTAGVPGTGMIRWDHQLDAEDRWDVAFYVWSLGDPAGSRQRGEEVYEAQCASCHGGDGNEIAEAPLVAPDRVALSRRDVASEVRDRHADDEVRLTEDELAAVVAYVWTLLYDPPGTGTRPEAVTGGRQSWHETVAHGAGRPYTRPRPRPAGVALPAHDVRFRGLVTEGGSW